MAMAFMDPATSYQSPEFGAQVAQPPECKEFPSRRPHLYGELGSEYDRRIPYLRAVYDGSGLIRFGHGKTVEE